MSSGAQGSPAPAPNTGVQSNGTLDEHADALASIFEKLEKGEPVDFFAEGVRCSLRLARTTGRFLWYWGNMAKLWLIDSDTPRWYPPPPVTGQSFAIPVSLDYDPGNGAQGGLRRRGNAGPDPNAKVTVGYSGGSATATIEGAGIPRGMYELEISTAAGQKHFENIYIDPTA